MSMTRRTRYSLSSKMTDDFLANMLYLAWYMRMSPRVVAQFLLAGRHVELALALGRFTANSWALHQQARRYILPERLRTNYTLLMSHIVSRMQ